MRNGLTGFYEKNEMPWKKRWLKFQDNIFSENNIIPNDKTLPGFLWRDKERPKSIQDLFSNADKLLDIVEID